MLRLATSATLGGLPWELLLHYVCNSTAHTSLPGAGVLSGHEARVQRFGAAALRQAFENYRTGTAVDFWVKLAQWKAGTVIVLDVDRRRERCCLYAPS